MTALRYPPRRTSFYQVGVEVPRPVIGLDIDGTLGRYHDHFIQFAVDWLGIWAPPMEYDGSVSLATFLGISKTRYRKVKLAYRQGGLKRSMPIYPGAENISRTVRKAGAEVVICTTRPFLQLEAVDPDTKEWLKRNGIQYDNLIHGEHKYRELAKRYSGRVIGVVEDLPELIAQAEALNLRPIVRAQPYNKAYISIDERTQRYYSLEVIADVLLERIHQYELDKGMR